MLKEKFEALKDYLIESGEGTEEELQKITAGQSYNSDFDYFELLGCEYLVLTDEEADEKTADYIKDSLWAFNADFILEHTAVYEETTHREDAEIIKALQMVQGSICESANALVRALIVDIDAFIEDAVDADGRGHFLASYDGEEYESGNFYIYRTN